MKRTKTYQRRQNRLGYLFMTPWIIGFAVFTLFPFIATVYLSFTEVNSTILGYEISFVGMSNYITAFFKNVEFVPALLSYLQMIIPYTFIVVVVSFIIAYMLNKITVLKGALRTIYFLPVIIMSGPVMYQLLDTKTTGYETEGISNYANIFILQIIDSYSPWLADVMINVFEQLSIILWFTGIPIVLMINGMQKINYSMYEAARIDSANSWQILWKITIPIIKPILLISTIFTIAQIGVYDINPVYTLIKTETNNTSGGLGFAATYSWIYSLLVMLLIGLSYLLLRTKKERYNK